MHVTGVCVLETNAQPWLCPTAGNCAQSLGEEFNETLAQIDDSYVIEFCLWVIFYDFYCISIYNAYIKCKELSWISYIWILKKLSNYDIFMLVAQSFKLHFNLLYEIRVVLMLNWIINKFCTKFLSAFFFASVPTGRKRISKHHVWMRP